MADFLRHDVRESVLDYDAYVQPSSRPAVQPSSQLGRGGELAVVRLITRVVGRSTLGELSTFQLLIYVTMGDLVRQAITQQDYSVTSGVLAVSVFAVLAIALSAANARWPAVRTVTHGIPVVVIGQGIVVVRISRATRWPPGDEPVPDEGRIPGISKARSR